MKRAATVVVLSSLFFLGMFLPSEETADHKSSPAFSASLERAVGMLEGTMVEVTAAATPEAAEAGAQSNKEPLTCYPGCDITYDQEFTCWYYEGCEPTGYLVCGPTLDEPTCEYYPTCNWTCEYYYGCEVTGYLVCGPTLDETTCEFYPTCEWTCEFYVGCEPTGDLVCGATYEYTCEHYQTCDHTCELHPTCQYTCEDYPTCQHTCEYYSTCELTCEYYPTSAGCPCHTYEPYPGCEPTGALVCPTYETCAGQPGCDSSTGRTSWGAIKDMF
jgi:hypothetical protein